VAAFLYPHATGLSAAERDSLALSVALHYRNNMRLMSDVSTSHGAEFLAVLQPALLFHERAGARIRTHDPAESYTVRFRDHVTSAHWGETPLLDLSSVFDSYYETIPVFLPGEGPDLSSHVFVDGVHLFEPGNLIVAREIWQRLADVNTVHQTAGSSR
jgi:hypothetical protein